MKIKPKPLDCYIGSFTRPLQEAYLEANGFSRGMILFSIPSHGVLFKCRADGDLLDLEFGAFFSLLRFIKTSLAKEKITSIRVHSSNCEFVFALKNNSRQVQGRRQRARMLKEYRNLFDIQTSLVSAIKNQTSVAPGDFSSTPKDQTPSIKPRPGKRSKIRFGPIHKGLSL